MGADRPATSDMPWSALMGSVRTYAMFTLDPSGVIDSWNAGVHELLGYEEDEFIGQQGSIIFTVEDRAAGVPELELQRAMEAGEAMDDRWHLRKDGSRLWANGIMHAVRDATGTLTGYIKIMRDQTEKRAADAQLKESEERFTTAFRNNPSPIAIVDWPGLRILDVNEAFGASFKLERPETIGHTLGELGVERTEEQVAEVMERMASGLGSRFEAPFRRSDGQLGHATFAFEPIQLGGEQHAVMLMHDVTEWRAAQEELEHQRGLITAVLNSLPGIFYLFDGERYVRWNDEVERVTGFSPEEIATAAPSDLVVEAANVEEHITDVFVTGEGAVQLLLRTKRGEHLPYLFNSHRIDLYGQPYIIGLGIEISDQVRSRELLERHADEQRAFADLAAYTLSEERVQPTLELAAERVARTLGAEQVNITEYTSDGPVIRASSALADATATDRSDEVERGGTSDVGYRAGGFLVPRAELAEAGMRSGIRASIRGHDSLFGSVEALSTRDDAFTSDDAKFLGSVAYLLASAVEQNRLKRELERRAETDDLTGLLKRVAFEHRLIAAIARAERQGTQVAVLFLDLDRFKEVNDTLGHQAGDQVLQEVANRIHGVVRSWDVIARHGGDEFVLFVPDIRSTPEATHVAERLIEAFEAPFEVEGDERRVGVTIGIASYPHDGQDSETLLKKADIALYAGKEQGRNSYHVYAPEKHTT